MKYAVIVTPEAEATIAAAFDYIAERSPLNAARWLRDLYKQIDGLEEFPRRFGEARERPHVFEEIRQAIFKSHRIIFTIDDASRVVHVLYVRHAKMRAVGELDDSE
ncbi:MAG: type II toxin-antitoxin system RelE/ParE family toxin [Tepidisphaeraceae bacterium]|jgi:plasmid stabilization system protein ParE